MFLTGAGTATEPEENCIFLPVLDLDSVTNKNLAPIVKNLERVEFLDSQRREKDYLYSLARNFKQTV